jgi:peptidoglycan/LPS O-acetylase OafA/YrhL
MLISPNPIYALLAIMLAYGISAIFARYLPLPDFHGRSTSIDGLRGFLAFGVFLYHSALWDQFVIIGKWRGPASAFYFHLGYGAVMMFFMITAFLFISKLIDAERKPVVWRDLFIGRVFRIMPLYLAMVAVMLSIVFNSQASLHEAPVPLVKSILHWMLLTLFNAPDINGLRDTWLLVAGVTWTLRFEVLFYLSLPVVALTMGRRVPVSTLLIVSILLSILLPRFSSVDAPLMEVAWAFAMGGVAAGLSKAAVWVKFSQSSAATILAMASMILPIWLFQEGDTNASAIFPLGIAFLIISAGNDLFGLLRTRASRFLGEITYGIYLAHGLLLYILIKVVLGGEYVAALPSLNYWMVVLATVPVLLLVATIGHFAIEKPGIELGRRFMKSRTARLGLARRSGTA